MPKKGKKGKGKGKKGKKGGKKGAGKKGAKDASVKSMSTANARLWEARLEVAEKSRHEYRESSRRLVNENDSLQTQMQQTEKDTIDVITYLKRQDVEKDRQMEKVITQMKDLKKEHRKEKESMVEDFETQISELEQRLGQKTHEVEVMQSELKLVKEFRRKRAHMQKELDEIKEAMFAANREHKDTLGRMEQKFFEEKMRLQQEANQKIAELAERAHTEAISNLDETTRSVYKENVRTNEALTYHMAEGSKLKGIKERLEEENEELEGEKEMNQMIIKEKVAQSKHQKNSIKDLQEKVDTLEKSLSHVVREFETERRAIVTRFEIENEASKVEICKLQRIVDLKTKEMNKVKKLAKNILDQRTEIERFFLDALQHVKQEIAANRIQYRRDAQAAYQQRMLAAYTGKGDYPKIRTFSKTDNSTNSVFRDLEAAERLCEEYPGNITKMIDISGKVDVSDLTWEQKEKVLRFLFAKMNGAKDRRGSTAPPSITSGRSVPPPSLTDLEAWGEKEESHDDQTFLTQAQVDDTGTLDKLPLITQNQAQIQIQEPVS